jgi:hypothetical protein
MMVRFLRETLNKSAFYGEPAQLCDAGINKIKVLAPLSLPQTFLHLFNQRFLKYSGLIVAALLTPFRLEAADKNTGKESEPLVFWAVNEGGAKIYQPNAAACTKISGMSVQYADGVSNRLSVPAYTLKITAIKHNENQSTCTLMIDTPAGLKECALGSVIRTFGGDYLAHTYQQFADGSVKFLNGECQ